MVQLSLALTALLFDVSLVIIYGFRPAKIPFKRASLTALAARRGRKKSVGPSPQGVQRGVAASPKPVAATITRPQQAAKTISLRIASGCIIHVAQIPSTDPWWDETRNGNPYGARLWPSGMGIAQHLWQQKRYLKGLKMLEVGCGTGLVSQAAALAGATVVASDVSPIALTLTRQGWKATTTASQRDEFSLATSIYDVSSPLPNDEIDVLVASCVLYEGDLGVIMARRIAEAYERGIWIILGDDDAGFREGGRQRFVEQLEDDINVSVKWNHGVVRCSELGWKQKSFSYLELNAPRQVAEKETASVVDQDHGEIYDRILTRRLLG